VAPTRNGRLYVGNLSYEATEAELEDLFKGFGNVRSVEIIYNPRTYKSKGYAFVEMQMLEDAQRAAEVLHGQPFMGRELMVSAASERPEGTDKPEESETPVEKKAAPAEETPAEAPEAPEAE
jgi:RNA recognition motif-containing protein